jgi:hypothetical protein
MPGHGGGEKGTQIQSGNSKHTDKQSHHVIRASPSKALVVEQSLEQELVRGVSPSQKLELEFEDEEEVDTLTKKRKISNYNWHKVRKMLGLRPVTLKGMF